MINLIPMAQSVKEKHAFFTFSGPINIVSQIELPLVETVKASNGINTIVIKEDRALEKEEYKLTVTHNGVNIKASNRVGAYYALQTLRQIGRFDEGKKTVPCVEIVDKPQFEWRGLNVDESRHFFGKDFIKKVIDDMFRLKINVLHWHLSDDQGWRIEIKKYPLLTEIGSKRKYTQIGGWQVNKVDNTPYGGFYTQDDIKEIVKYAADRCVSIVPEIDIPAHFAAALAAYPQLACRNLKRDVQGFFGGIVPKKKGVKDWNRPLCVSKDETFHFICDVYEEVTELFPFKYFHIGGDECNTSEWQMCPECQKMMRENGLENERDLQVAFENRVSAFLKEKGKTAICWNDILKGQGADKENIVIQQWLPGQDKAVKQFVNDGGRVIMSNHKEFYYDMPYAQTPLKKAYNYSLKKYGINDENIQNVLGVECEMWTEWIATEEKFMFLLHPRFEAFAEVAWLKEEKRNYKNFIFRYENYKSVLGKLGIIFAKTEIANPQNPIKRAEIVRKFRYGNPDTELLENKKGDKV